MTDKQYKNIKEVAKQLDIKEHVIRYWDSFDHKTKKMRFVGLSVRRNGIRYFNKENIKKLEQLKNLLYENGKHNYSLALANKIILNKKNEPAHSSSINKNSITYNQKKEYNFKDLNKIIIKMRKLLNG